MRRSVDVLAVAAALAAAVTVLGAEPAPGPAAAPTNVPALWFPVGEDLTYNIYWGIIHVGATEVTTRWEERDGEPRLVIRYRTRTSRVLSTLYPVDDLLESVVDPGPFLPVQFTKKLSEGGYRADEVTRFDHAAGRASWESKRSGNTKEFAIDADTRDLISMMYWLRARPFVAGRRKDYRVMADEKVYDLHVLARKRETLRLPGFGKVPVVRVEPTAEFQGLFVRKGQVVFWVADDDRRLCVKIEGDTPFANVRLILDDVRGPGTDRWIRAKSPPANARLPAAGG